MGETSASRKTECHCCCFSLCPVGALISCCWGLPSAACPFKAIFETHLMNEDFGLMGDSGRDQSLPWRGPRAGWCLFWCRQDSGTWPSTRHTRTEIQNSPNMSKLFEEWEGEASTSFLNIWYWTSMYICKFAHRTFRFGLSPSPPAALCDTSAQTSWGPRSSRSPPTPFPFQFVMSSSAKAKILRFTIPISEREPLRLARAAQNSLRAFGCQLSGSCSSSAVHILSILFSLSICNLKTLIVHITFSCK